MGKRIAVPRAAEVSFGERLAPLRTAAGFTQIELAAERGQLKRKAEFRA